MAGQGKTPARSSAPRPIQGQIESAPASNRPFELLEVESTYEVVDDVMHRYTRRDVARLRYDARFYERRYRWTGSPTRVIEPEVLSSSGAVRHKLHGPVLREGDDALFLVDLGQTLAANRKVEISTRNQLLDEGGTFQPYLRHRISASTGALTLRIRIPPETFVNVSPFVMNANTSARHSIPKKLEIIEEEKSSGAFAFRIEKPRVGYVYGIEWL
ncbi:hypothetical protein [Nocardioides pyridinolyticus]